MGPGGPTSHGAFQETEARGREMSAQGHMENQRQNQAQQSGSLDSPRHSSSPAFHCGSETDGDTLTLSDTLTHIGTQRSRDAYNLSRNSPSRPLHTQTQPPPRHPPGGEQSPTRSHKTQFGLQGLCDSSHLTSLSYYRSLFRKHDRHGPHRFCGPCGSGSVILGKTAG